MSEKNDKIDPTAVLESEARGEKVATFDWRGHTFTVSREYNDWSVDFLESLEEGKSVGIVRGAVTEADWRFVKSLRLTVRELNELAAEVSHAMGFGEPGESAASSS